MEGITLRESERGLVIPFNTLDKMMNHLMENKLSKLDMWVFLRIASHCWSKKSVCTKSAIHLAKESGKTKHSIRTSIKKLSKLNYVVSIYRLEHNHVIKTFKSFEAAQEFRESHAVRILGSHFRLHTRANCFCMKNLKLKTSSESVQLPNEST